jgi:hypothetical protein
MRVVYPTINLEACGPGEGGLAQDAPHLVTAVNLVNWRMTVRTWLCLTVQKADRGDRIGIAGMTFGQQIVAFEANMLCTHAALTLIVKETAT